jgi:hypothetical protein
VLSAALKILREFSLSDAGESWKGFPYEQRRELIKQNIADLLANLMHYCADNRIDFADRLLVAESHFKSERGGQR